MATLIDERPEDVETEEEVSQITEEPQEATPQETPEVSREVYRRDCTDAPRS